MSSCKESGIPEGEIFKGEMFLKLIDWGTEEYLSPENKGVFPAELFESIPDSALTLQQLEVKNTYDILQKEKVLGNPFFNFAEYNSDEDYVKVYLNNDEYEKIKHINLTEIRKAGKKVKISFYGTRIAEGVFKCYSIADVKTVRGDLQWAK